MRVFVRRCGARTSSILTTDSSWDVTKLRTACLEKLGLESLEDAKICLDVSGAPEITSLEELQNNDRLVVYKVDEESESEEPEESEESEESEEEESEEEESEEEESEEEESEEEESEEEESEEEESEEEEPVVRKKQCVRDQGSRFSQTRLSFG